MSGDAVVESAPSSTSDVAANVIESLEPSVEETAAPETGEAPETPAAQVPAVVEPELPAAAKFLVAKGHKWGKRADGKTDLAFLPATSVAKFLDEYADQHRLTWDGEKKTLSEQLKEMQEALTEQRTLITGDPRNYLSELAKFDPRYQAFLEEKRQEAQQPLAIPEPDVTLADGSRTFSLETFQKTLIPFIVEQAKKEAKAEAENALKPIREREEQQKTHATLRERTQSMIAEAKNWPGFGDHEQDILKALQEDSDKAKAAGKRPSLSLEAAYRQVVLPKLSADRNKMREELLKELSESAKAGPTVARTGGDVQQKPGPADTRDIAARTIERLERGQ